MIRKSWLGVMLLLVFFVSSLSGYANNYERSQSEFAEIEAVLNQQLKSVELSKCQNILVPIYDIETIKFLSFLEEHFQSKNANTILMDLAFKRYVQYKQNLEKALFSMEVQTSVEGETLVSYEEVTSFQRCIDLQKAYQDMAKEQMISHIKANSSQKKTSALVEKYESLNSRMGEMNLEMAQLKGYFLSFKNRLPGFIKSCFKALI